MDESSEIDLRKPAPLQSPGMVSTPTGTMRKIPSEENVWTSGGSGSSTSPESVVCMTRQRRKHILGLMHVAITTAAQQQREIIAKDAHFCRLCILDAFQGRLSNGLANNSKKSWWIYTIFSIQTSDWLFNAVIGACVFHTLSVFAEPTNQCSASLVYFLLQILILAIYTFDISLKMGYEGLKVRHMSYVTCVPADVCVCVSTCPVSWPLLASPCLTSNLSPPTSLLPHPPCLCVCLCVCVSVTLSNPLLLSVTLSLCLSLTLSLSHSVSHSLLFSPIRRRNTGSTIGSSSTS
jgi:hypothetical protein